MPLHKYNVNVIRAHAMRAATNVYCLYILYGMMYNQIWIIFGEVSVFLTEQQNPNGKHDVGRVAWRFGHSCVLGGRATKPC